MPSYILSMIQGCLLKKLENMLLIVFFVIVFSSDYHFLWLIYDVLAIFAFFYTFKITKKVNLILIASILFFIVLALYSGSHLISYLSIWDNAKHIFVINMIFKLINKNRGHKGEKLFRRISKPLAITFIIEVIIVFFQYNSGYHFDNISGTFGYGASHSIGYFSLLYIAYRVYFEEKINFTTLLVILLSIIMNYMSENMGFYILLLAMLAFYNLKYSVYFLVFILTIYLTYGSISNEFVNSMLSRFGEYIDVEQGLDLYNIKSSRGALTKYAFYLGDFFGVGPGAYSNIYGFEGWKLDELFNSQIDISTVTSLLSEYGLIGLLIWWVLYIYAFTNVTNHKIFKVFLSIFVTLIFFYNKLLMDERIILMLIMIIAFMKIHINRKGST